MEKPRKNLGRKRGQNTFTTKSGKTIKLNRSISERSKARKDIRAREKAAYLSTLPKNRFKRILYRLHPKRLAAYWFSREGGIMALKITGVGIVAGFLILVGTFAYFRKDLPKITDIEGSSIGGSITYYDRTGQTVLWQDYDAVQRFPVKDEEISQHMKNATIAIEDKNFYKHGAFDVTGLARAAWNDVAGGKSRQGGSTITQQLVKMNQDWTEDRTYTRKIKELILAVELEREYTKKEILTGYLNIAPYGGIEYGVEAAARNYFHTSAKDLTLAQSAFLAAIPQSPTYYSPYNPDYSNEALIGRQHYILDQMVDQKMISKEEAEEAKAVDIVATVHPRQPKYSGIKAPYFVLAAKKELEQKYGSTTVNRGGWKVTTSLDMGLQAEAEKQVANALPIIKRQKGDVAAFAASDVQTGQMVAVVGGVDFSNKEFGEINYAQTELPPGSSFKPYDYATVIENSTSAGAGSVLYDIQAPITGYPCTNKQRPRDGGNCLWDYDFKFPGPVSIRYALGGSRNVPAVKAMLIAGVEKTIKTAESMGLTSGYNCYADEKLTQTAPCYASSAIGDGAFLKLDEHVNSYGTFSRNGTYIPKTYILKVVDAGGKTLDEWKPPKGKQAIRPDTAYIISDMLSDPNASYMSQKIHNFNGWKFAVKTGTTNDAKDGWMMGYSAKYAAGVWVGYHDRTREMSGFMENMTRPVWYNWMKAAHQGQPAKNWEKPEGVKTAPAYVVRSHVGSGSREPSPANDLYPSWYKPKEAGGNTSQVMDKVSNKVATDCTPEAAKQNASNARTSSFSIDIFVDANGRGTGAAAANTTATDDIHNCSDIKPTVTVMNPATPCLVNNVCQLTVTIVQGTHALVDPARTVGGGTVDLLINDQKVDSQAAGNTVTFNYTPTAPGAISVSASVIDSVLYSSTSNPVTVTVQ
jgi:membrane peptidoglycan carboxypeptidase